MNRANVTKISYTRKSKNIEKKRKIKREISIINVYIVQYISLPINVSIFRDKCIDLVDKYITQ